MECPHCRNRCSLGDGICRTCRWSFTLGTLIAIAPPRSPGAMPTDMLSAHRRRRLLRSRVAPADVRWVGPCLLALIPGAGHAAHHQWRQAGEIAVVTVVLTCTAVTVVDAEWGGVLLGFAATIHGYSLIDLTPLARRSSLAVRLLALLGAASVLYALAYRPLLYTFGRDLPMRLARWGDRSGGENAAAVAWIALVLVIAGIAAAIARFRRPLRGNDR
ncbi:MAG: hypothetical protein H0W72_07900 [Planctomycetes bacterium]|nr:hypothetical protein [Planctomycetota bacterium]